MKFFRKINLGVIALLIVVISVAVYMIYMNGKHNDLGKKADDFLTSFFDFIITISEQLIKFKAS